MLNTRTFCRLAAIGLLVSAYHHAASAAAVLRAEYLFNNTLSSNVAGAPDLTVVNPQGQSGFTTDTVFGSSRLVYNFQSSGALPSQQAGLQFNNSTGLIGPNDYSVQVIFKLTQGDGGWRRILDSQNRQSDSGFYVDPTNHLDVFPATVSGPQYPTGTYVNVALTISGTDTVAAYMNGLLEFSRTTDVMDITSDNVLSFFLDNIDDGGTEWSPGDIAAARIYSGVLTQDQIEALNNMTTPTGRQSLPTNTPEPATVALLATGIAALALSRRRRPVPRAVSPR